MNKRFLQNMERLNFLQVPDLGFLTLDVYLFQGLSLCIVFSPPPPPPPPPLPQFLIVFPPPPLSAKCFLVFNINCYLK